MKKFLLSILVCFLIAFSFKPVTAYAAGNVAEVNGIQYAALSEAINAASEGETITLLSDVTEKVVLNKNVIIDGGNQYTIKSQESSTITNGTVQNVTLNPVDKAAKLYVGNQTEETKITFENVTILYDVTTREYYTYTQSNNMADVIFHNTRFINIPDNQGNVENVSEWSYGIYINDQNDTGTITFTNSKFEGAYRTMLSSVSGNVKVEGCSFINSVYSVNGGPTSGSQAEATCLTTSQAANNNIIVINNTFNNAGAIYVQTQLNFSSNTIIADGIMHYIQARGSIGSPVDFSQNAYHTGTNHYVIFDTPGAPVKMPAGMSVIDGWVWNDTPNEIKPADYLGYLYMYNEDGSITYLPQIDAALDQFINQNAGNKKVTNNDVVRIEKNLKLDNLKVEADRILTFEIIDPAVLEISGTVDLEGRISIKGNGSLKIANDSAINVNKTGTFSVETPIQVENNGTIANEGSVIVPDNISGTGTLSGTGSVEQLHLLQHISAVAPTCTTSGNIEYWHCSTCDKCFKDEDLKVEITKSDTFLPAKGHNYVNGQCTECGKEIIVTAPTIDTTKPVEEITAGISKDSLTSVRAETSAIIEAVKNGKEVTNVNFKDEKSKEMLKDALEVTIEISVDKVKEENVDQTDIKAIKEKVTEISKNRGAVVQYFDLNIILKADNQPIGNITEMAQPLTFTIAVPSDLNKEERAFLFKEGRAFYMLCVHDGVVEKPIAEYKNNIITFSTNKFYICSLIYEDAQSVETINHAPTINANDITLTVGDKFDPLTGVTATDKEDGEIKSIEVVKNTVDTSKAGTYEVTYKVTDRMGASATKTITVTVKERKVDQSEKPKDPPTPDTDEHADTSSTAPSNNNIPVTGDSSNIVFYIAILVISGLLISIMVIYKKKKK